MKKACYRAMADICLLFQPNTSVKSGEVGNLKMVQPLRLPVVLGGQDAGVEEHQDDNEPEHSLKITLLYINTRCF
jgi:hypothetical protein